MFSPIGIKTDYSLLQSLIKIEDLVLYAKKNNLKTIGILDDNLCSSHVFYGSCIKEGIKPVIGLDIIIDDNRLYLYAKNMNGLVNLFKLYKEKDEVNLKLSDLKKYAKDVIAVVPFCEKNIFTQVKEIYEEVFISFKNKQEEKEVSLITDNKIYIKETLCLNSNQSKYINYLHMIENNKKLGEVELKDYKDSVIELSLYDTSKLTDLIKLEFPKNKMYIPKFIDNSKEYLKSLAIKGLNKRLNNNVSDNYLQRLNYELDIINKMGFTDYFLIVFDYVRFALKNKIFVGVGRGSAVGSLVAYSLGITWIDPIKYDLLFERFLNPNRVSMPDIDIDFEDERRDEVVDYVKEKYNSNNVAKIMTFGTLTAKDVLRSVAKINNVNELQINMLLKNINSKLSLKDNLNNINVKNILARNSLLKKTYDESFYLEGIKKHIGTHAAGVVICSEDLTNIVPVIKSGDEYLTGYQMNELEELGLIKMDFLSIRNLTIIKNVLKDIYEHEGVSININDLSLNDKKAYELLSAGDTVGIFQFESSGMKKFIKRLKPKTFDDLVMAIAIYRPGAMDSIDEYLALKNNHKKINYIDPCLEPILKSTYGILIYQEQIMEILRVMGGFNYSEADIIRRAISKKKSAVINEYKEQFINNGIKLGNTYENLNKVYDLIIKFANFGFNKSHSVAYAMIAYQMAYLKTHYKEYYYINLLNGNIGGEAKTKEYIEEAKKNGIKILKPDINKSEKEYIKVENGIRLPLRVIKGVGLLSSDAIINNRKDIPYEDFFDFVSRCYGFNVNKKTLEVLIYADAFSEFKYNKATLLKNIEPAIMYADLIKTLDSSLVNKPEMIIENEMTEIDLMNKEKELFGYYVSTHPAGKYPNVMKQIDIEKYFDKIITTVVLVENIKRLKTKNNKDMAFILGSDETISSDFVIFDDQIKQLDNIKVGDLVHIKGRVEKRLDKYQIVVNCIKKI